MQIATSCNLCSTVKIGEGEGGGERDEGEMELVDKEMEGKEEDRVWGLGSGGPGSKR